MESLPIVVPVRFSGGGLTMQTTTSRMGLTGAFVRCLVGPKQGAEMTLEITLPGGKPAVKLRGTVTETIPIGSKGKEAGFWVQFASSDSALESFLVKKGGLQPGRPAPKPSAAAPTAAAPPPPAAAVRPPAATPTPAATEPPRSRIFPRLRTRLRVSWATAREFLVAYSDNISMGGVFIATDKPPAMGEVVELSLDLPDGEAPARTHAQVIQRTTVEEGKRAGRTAGAGLQFIGGDDEFRRRLDACIDNLLK
jgi:uncharacterized protein (TIGR02266 family)